VIGDIYALGKLFRDEMIKEVKKLCVPVVFDKTIIDIVPKNPDAFLVGAATPILTIAFGFPRFVPDHD
jgi:hypothetical protein